MTGKTGHYAILEQFLADGVKYIFGNPGTVEQGLIDALADYPELNYVLTLQESVALMTADGYARATQKPAVVQIHSAPGLGNAVGAMYQAMRGHAPLVVIGGDAGIKYQALDAQMAADLVAIAEPVTKWSTMVSDASSLLRVLRRAIKIASTAPMGPVYVCLPQDILNEVAIESVRPTSLPSTQVAPDVATVQAMAELLVKAAEPMIYIGDGVAYSGAQEALTRVAELLGAEVRDVDSGELNMDTTHPLYQGSTGHMFGSSSLSTLQRGDVNLVCGTYLLPEVFPEVGDIFAPDARVLHIDLNAYEIAKNHPVDLGVVCDPKLTLTALADIIQTVQTDAQRLQAIERKQTLAAAKDQRRQRAMTDDLAAHALHFSSFMKAFAAQLPTDTVVFDEALTASPVLTRYLPPRQTGHYFVTRGGSLGVGIPGAIGLKLANPDKTVVGFTGDGGSMYTIQALWTAARYNIDAKFVICNNRSYKLLQLNIEQFWQEESIPAHSFPLDFDLSYPAIQFSEMARSMGVEAMRIERPEEIEPAIKKALTHKGPFLLDVVIAGNLQPDAIEALSDSFKR
ncbi:MAG: thiamine pyrophosphate-binding protein [Symploca sp. SIO2G7]|nr:thiamine pyrophosphate-binding protein [Symploca sp. SIO2G7]